MDAPAARTDRTEPVTDRQREVARLIAEDKSNREIADALGISLDGAKYHVSELLGRLGLARREDVGAWYREHYGWRTRLRALFALPLLPVLLGGGAVAAVVVVAVVVVVAWGNGGAAQEEPGRLVAPDALEDLGAAPWNPNGGAATMLDTGRVLATGGYQFAVDDLGNSREAWLYDPAANEWEPVGDMLFPRVGHAIVPLEGGRALVGGGAGLGQSTSSAVLQIFDSATGEFSAARVNLGSRVLALVSDGRGGALVLSERNAPGRSDDGQLVISRYDPSTDTAVNLRTFVRVPSEVLDDGSFSAARSDDGHAAFVGPQGLLVISPDDAVGDWLDMPASLGVDLAVAGLGDGRFAVLGGIEESSKRGYSEALQQAVQARNPEEEWTLPALPSLRAAEGMALVDASSGAVEEQRLRPGCILRLIPGSWTVLRDGRLFLAACMEVMAAGEGAQDRAVIHPAEILDTRDGSRLRVAEPHSLIGGIPVLSDDGSLLLITQEVTTDEANPRLDGHVYRLRP